MGFNNFSGMRISACCKDCTEKYQACHDYCEKYQKALDEWNDLKQKARRAKYDEYELYRQDAIQKMKKRRQKIDRRS